MITELNKSEFYKIRHITDKCKNIEVRAVVSGNNPGGVYVDHPTEPTAALIWIEGQKGFQIVGDAQSTTFITELAEYMRNHIEPKLQEQDINWVEIGLDPDPWDKTIQNIFQERRISSDTQHVFTLRGKPQHIEFQDSVVNIQPINREVLKSKRLENHSFLEKKILRFWDSIDSFLEQGFGYFVEDNHNVVSLCFSAFVVDKTHAIDIETLEEHKRRNYGAAVAQAFVQECLQKGIRPYWDCTPENTGSIRLAEKVGMTPDFDYQISWYGLP
ncbi:GNAT family N-acetyltransferase [Paenibacillus sp. p3-SID867]|uniref:GNAT family N-acetyltransferase n=1 Tax=Paenibacillus sp. p3-SID867 TaxID=2916363 RepID=UPI0021A5726C|nr:GNAT family N-acetyltransferase [Paenibacillus sp. p3-SID867]MCT1399447.1 GNAT family N-acetyltransferase [Paenibacillus sp. p3-SID867]